MEKCQTNRMEEETRGERSDTSLGVQGVSSVVNYKSIRGVAVRGREVLCEDHRHGGQRVYESSEKERKMGKNTSFRRDTLLPLQLNLLKVTWQKKGRDKRPMPRCLTRRAKKQGGGEDNIEREKLLAPSEGECRDKKGLQNASGMRGQLSRGERKKEREEKKGRPERDLFWVRKKGNENAGGISL